MNFKTERMKEVGKKCQKTFKTNASKTLVRINKQSKLREIADCTLNSISTVFSIFNEVGRQSEKNQRVDKCFFFYSGRNQKQSDVSETAAPTLNQR